jgi:hypothetical protein
MASGSMNAVFCGQADGCSVLIEAGVLLDQGVGIPSGWISTADGRIARA